MAPVSSDVVDDLKAMIAKLESRVQELEGKVERKATSIGASKGPSTMQQLRMILIGPPGAGRCCGSLNAIFGLTEPTGKGTQAPNLKDKYCACHLVR